MRNVRLPIVCLVSIALAAQDLSFGSREARPAPEWLGRSVIYEVWLNAFSEEGTLRGAIPRLPYLADLGVGIIYLAPIAKRSAKPNASPYSIADYDSIDPQYGTSDDRAIFTSSD